ncbi:hypothetical protein H5410_040131 [Solanum commersonii]|uniref:SWIM-type domain-containing protein n=1 Tax=Solanum commersonii TaxID=4109 RepID=A0A9J5XN09_SOLCO|nr:hypothetical protein H5410_040131 [Solanum commersonii]
MSQKSNNASTRPKIITQIQQNSQNSDLSIRTPNVDQNFQIQPFDPLTISLQPRLLGFLKLPGMSGFVEVTLIWYHGGVLDVSSRNPVYVGEIQSDRDIFELCQDFQNGDTIEVYVCHMVDQMDGPIVFLEYTGSNEESLGTFNKETKGGVEEGGQGVHFTKSTTEPAAFTELPTTGTTSSSQPASQPTNTETFGELESEYSIENSSESDREDLFNKGEAEYDSDVHEECINLRAERRTYQRRKRRERLPNDPEEIHVGKVGPDLGFDETNVVDKSLKGNVVGDEPVYCSSDAFSVKTNTNDEIGPRSTSRRVIFDKFAEKVGVQLEKYINKPKKVSLRCREGCPWMLYASLDKSSDDFIIKTYIHKHKCVKTTRNCMCNARFLGKHYWDRIVEQPNIRIFKFQELIRKEMKIHVGKTTAKRARGKILKGIMGDHVLEFGRILDYRNEMLRTNPESTCVLKIDDSEGSGRMKSFLGGCRKCIVLDGCFLKGVTKGQLLCVVAKDDNNQIRVEYGNNIEFNGEKRFEIHDGPYQHTVDIRSKACTCRAWMLKGIPCPHAIAAIYYKKWEPIDFVDSCYITNMKMWPESINPHVQPPVVKSMPGRPGKVKRREVGETKTCGKLSRKGVYMTCSICHGKNHNKRGCPLKDHAGPSKAKGRPRKAKTTVVSETPPRGRGRPRKETTTTEAPPIGRGKPRKETTTSEAPPRGRGRPRNETTTTEAPPRGRGRPIKETTTTEAPPRATESGKKAHLQEAGEGEKMQHLLLKHLLEPLEGGGKTTSTYEVDQEPARGRGRPRKTPTNGMTIPMPRRTSFAEWFENPTSYQLPVAPTPHVASQSSARNSNAPTSYDAPVEPPAKKPKTVGMGVFVAEDRFTVYNHGLTSSRIIHTGSRKPIRLVDVIGDLGYKPRTGVRWKGKTAVTTGQLEEMRVNKRKNSSSSQPKKAWK